MYRAKVTLRKYLFPVVPKEKAENMKWYTKHCHILIIFNEIYNNNVKTP